MPVTFFLDRSLGKEIVAEALRVAGAHVEIHDDRFPPDAKDEDWLNEVGRWAGSFLRRTGVSTPEYWKSPQSPDRGSGSSNSQPQVFKARKWPQSSLVNFEDKSLCDRECCSIHSDRRSECQGEISFLRSQAEEI